MKLVSPRVVTRHLTCAIFLILCVVLEQRVLPRHQQAAAPLQSPPLVQLKNLSMVSLGTHLRHSPPVSNLRLRILQVGSLSRAPRCLYQVTRV